MEWLEQTTGRKTYHRVRQCDHCGETVHLKGKKSHVANSGVYAFFELNRGTSHYCTKCAPQGNKNSPMYWRVEGRQS